MIEGFIFVLMRWLHLGSMAMLVGGLSLVVLSAGSAKTLLRDETAAAVVRKIEARYRLVLMAAVFGLVISGVYQWVIFSQAYQELGTTVLVVLSIKVLIATAVFALLWAFQVDSMVGDKARVWRWVNLSLAVLVLMLAGVVRYLRLGHVGM
jgi:uncharacterized membrane protein